MRAGASMLLAATLAACGAKVEDDGTATGETSQDEGSTADGSAGSTSATATSSSATSSSSATATAETGDPLACDPSDTDPGPAVSISIVNETGLPIHFTQALGCSIGVPYAIERGGAPVVWLFEDCVSCLAVASGQCGCPGACAADSVIRIEPDGSWVGSWLGYEAVPTQLEPDCANESCGDQCTAKKQAPAGDYTFRAIAGTEAACGAPTCDCLGPPDPAGWCSVSGQIAGDLLEASVMLAYPDETTVTLVFM